MKNIKPRYRLTAVIIVMIVSLIALGGQYRPVDAVERVKSTNTLPHQNQAVQTYIDSVFGSCAKQAQAYLANVNPSYTPSLITHNRIGDTFIYDSSYVGLFQLNDSIPAVSSYTTTQLEDYKTNTDIAYGIFVANGDTFPGIACGGY